jgi:hypothetical protein
LRALKTGYVYMVATNPIQRSLPPTDEAQRKTRTQVERIFTRHSYRQLRSEPSSEAKKSSRWLRGGIERPPAMVPGPVPMSVAIPVATPRRSVQSERR